MPSQLCKTCLSIPSHFWAEDLDYQGFPWGPNVKLQPYRSMEKAAARGCPLCKILIHSAQTDFLDESTLEKVTVTLSRATMDSHQGVCLAVQQDDISHTTFYRAPEEWNGDPALGLDDHVDNFQVMKSWIQNCRRNHELCNWDLENFLPTRLLDLQAFKTGQDVRLVSIKTQDFDDQPFQPEYVTLSHCWGPPEKSPITTTKANLRERMTRISIDALSNTFRDAVRITRELGERYLWIDSLCIVQDDEDDWAREAALMAEVYGQSMCTLAALSSQDSTEGCRLVSDIQNIGAFLEFDSGNRQRDVHSYRIRIFEDEPRQWHEEYGDNPYRHRDYGNNPLRTRAWTLQERELSRRGVHFGEDQILWECRELKASAQLPWHHKKPEDDFEQWPIRNKPAEDIAPGGSVMMRDRWYELMEDYSSRRLTKHTDKLPALSGLAQGFQREFPQGEYLAGLWSAHLPAALLWRTRYTGCRPQSYIAPTWSWASIIGKITYESQRLRDSGGRIEDRPEEVPSDFDFGRLSVDSFAIQPKHEDKYSTILSATLSLKGALLVSLDPNPQLREFEHDYSGEPKAILTKNGATVGLLYPDVRSEMPYTGELFCLEIRREPHESESSQPSGLYGRNETADLVMGLVLVKEPTVGNELPSPSRYKKLGLLFAKKSRFGKDSESPDQYRRIGLARWVKKSLFRSSRPSVVTLL